MGAKEFLEQVYYIDQHINSKLEQITTYREMAKKATSLLTDMPKSKNSITSPMEEVICRMVDLENEINDDIDVLVDLKREIIDTIRKVARQEYQILLELRYLCFKAWDQIANKMGYDTRYLLKLHLRALEQFEAVRNQKQNDVDM